MNLQVSTADLVQPQRHAVLEALRHELDELGLIPQASVSTGTKGSGLIQVLAVANFAIASISMLISAVQAVRASFPRYTYTLRFGDESIEVSATDLGSVAHLREHFAAIPDTDRTTLHLEIAAFEAAAS